MKIFSVVLLIKSIMYFLIIFGIWLIFSDQIVSLLKRTYYSRFRIRKYKFTEGKLFKHIFLLVSLTWRKGSIFSVYSFIIFSLTLFIVVFILLLNQTSYIFAFAGALIIGFIPYANLYLRLNTIRTEGSHEADIIVSELLNQYKMNYFNMIEAIDCLVYFNEAPVSRKAFYRLSLKLKEYKREEALIDALKEVNFIINTDWMKMLTNNIYLAIECNINVSIGLEDILQELREAKTTAEKAKQINSEGFSILKYFSPFMYLATIYISIRYFGFTIKKFFIYQFYTEIGIRFFVMIIVLMFINISCMVIFQKQKFDF